MRSRSVLGAVAVSILGVSGSLCAQAINRWDSIGPPRDVPFNFPSQTASIAIDPSAPSTLYAGTSRALYKSENGGATWLQVLEDRIGSPINPTYRTYTHLSIDPADPSTVFTATGGGSVYRTRDGGEHWLAVVPSEGVASVFASSGGGPVFACVTPSAGSLTTLRSTDSGTTWAELPALAGRSIQAFADDPANPGRVWAAVSQDPAGAAVYVSDDGGTTWTPRSTGIAGTRPTDLVIDPDDPQTMYVATADAGVFRTSDGGESWAPANRGLASLEVVALAAGPGSNVYAGTRLEGLYRSDDGGAHWTAAGLREQQIYGLALDPSNPATLYAAAGALMRITWGPQEPCATSTESLCLQGQRFLVRSSWRTDHDSGVGQAAGVTPDTGYFWFFAPENVEVMLKILDGGAVNGNLWVFYGALSNVEYVITVVDTALGTMRSYYNFPGVLASVADTCGVSRRAFRLPARSPRPRRRRRGPPSPTPAPRGRWRCA